MDGPPVDVTVAVGAQAIIQANKTEIPQRTLAFFIRPPLGLFVSIIRRLPAPVKRALAPPARFEPPPQNRKPFSMSSSGQK
jgi:hypothetical protein